MMKRLLITSLAAAILTACGGEDAADYVQQKAPATEPENHSEETANELHPGSGSGVYGDLVAGEEDYYFIKIDFWDNGNHTIELTDLAEDLDLEVTDHNGNVILSENEGTADESIVVSTEDVSFFGDDIDYVVIKMRVYGFEGAASRFTLKLTNYAYNND
ncbi:MAG: hypothetical protein VW258_06830 [Thalassolituus sp.]